MIDYTYILIGLFIAVICTGIILNILLLIVLSEIKNQRKSYFALVISLIFADLGLPLFTSLCFVGSVVLGSYPWDYYLSYLNSVSYEYLLYVILLNLIALAAEHYVAIIKPLHYVNWVRCRYIVCRLCAIWIIAGLLVFFGYLIPQTKVSLTLKWNYLGKRNITQVLEKNIDMKDAFRIPFILVCLYSDDNCLYPYLFCSA